MYNKYTILRDKNNATDYQVSKATGINSSMFTHWKNGIYNPKIDKLQKIADYFGVPITYFLEDNEDKASEEVIIIAKGNICSKKAR